MKDGKKLKKRLKKVQKHGISQSRPVFVFLSPVDLKADETAVFSQASQARVMNVKCNFH